jgi:monoterpene epsilon-lactone hydrolase
LRLNPTRFAAFVPEAARGNVEDQEVLVPARRGTRTWRAQDGSGRLKRLASEIKRKDHAMQTTAAERGTPDVVTTHPLDPEDAAITAAMRTMLSAVKGKSGGPVGAARGQFDGLMEGVQPREDVTSEAGVLGGVPGVWVNPANGQPDLAILHLHGGWFNFGSAKPYRHLVGHIAARAGAKAFIPDYRLAPEHPFPAAVDDALACYRDLAGSGVRRLALTGDSAGGALALGLALHVTRDTASSGAALVGVAVLSPVTDLTLSGETYQSRAEADPLFTRPQVAGLIEAYLGGADAKDPKASPLFGDLAGLPPVRIHVGDDELLLDDSRRFAARAAAAGVDARVDVWMGMSHGFQANVGKMKAAGLSLDLIGAFLAGWLQASSRP